MKKLLVIILLTSFSVQGYALRFYNDTKEKMGVYVRYHFAHDYPTGEGYCRHDDLSINPGESRQVDTGICCIEYLKAYNVKNPSIVADYHISMCEYKDFHIVYKNPSTKEIRIDWRKFGR